MRAWLRQHGFALGEAMRHVVRAPGSFCMNALVVAIALAMPFAGLTILENMRPVSGQIAIDPEISVFLTASTPRDKSLAIEQPLRSIIRELSGDASVEFKPREKALNDLRSRTGLADTLAALGENPLPDGYVIRLTGMGSPKDAARLDGLLEKLRKLPGVDHVQVDSAWVKRLVALMQVFRLALLFSAATLAVVVISVVFNTIRLQVMTQREEIEVSRLCGATNAFIYRPFVYTGALLGLCAGIVALLAVGLMLHPLNKAVAEVARMYASEFRLVPLGALPLASLLACSMTLGSAGALLSVRRQLAR